MTRPDRQAQPFSAVRYTALARFDPDGLDVQVLVHLLDSGLAAIPAHLVAAERDSWSIAW